MGARGRKSLASETGMVVAGGFGQRPEPPANLTDGQKAIWRATVASEVPDFFKTAALKALLVDYCRHMETAATVTAALDEMDIASLNEDADVRRWDTLSRIRDRETKGAADKATKLRLTNQSRYTPGAAATAAKSSSASKPWEATG